MSETAPNTLPGDVEIAVAGGSIAGLCAGNALSAAGFDVHIFERAAGRLTSRGAGIVVQPELLGLLAMVDAPPLATTGCTIRRMIAGANGAMQEMYMPQRFTSWEAIYTSLLGAFPEDRYHTGTEITVVETLAEGVRAKANSADVSAQLFLAADGFRSAARAQYAPETISRYAGYVAWRGVVDEADLPSDLVAFFNDTFSFCNLDDGGHALCYFIPGDGLGTEPGTRRLNWVWYVTVVEGSALDAIMTDRDGRRRDAAVPQGFVNDHALQDLYGRATGLNRRFADLVRATSDPFIQSILDIAPAAMTFGRVCLIGDAAFVVRPHTAAAAAKAAADASALARALRGNAPDMDRGLAVWQRLQLPMGRELVNYGVMLGERSRQQGAR